MSSVLLIMKYVDFLIVFNILKIIGQIHFCLHLQKEVLKKCFWQNHKANYGASFNTQKSRH